MRRVGDAAPLAAHIFLMQRHHGMCRLGSVRTELADAIIPKLETVLIRMALLFTPMERRHVLWVGETGGSGVDPWAVRGRRGRKEGFNPGEETHSP